MKHEMVFITASHNFEILQKNLLLSQIFEKYPLEIMAGYNHVPTAYNQCKSKGDIYIYIHHDVWLPPQFEYQLQRSIKDIEYVNFNWGVLGIAGVVPVNNNKKNIYGRLMDRGIEWPGITELPHHVQTLDELILITNGRVVFDENLPGNHFYGADICMKANLSGKTCWAIDAYLHHNSNLPQGGRPADFEPCREYFRKKYINHLPIATTCTLINS